jgi:putative DNA primase/helicase
LRQLRERGRFVQPVSAAEAISELEDLGSPINAFVRDCCLVQPGQSVPVDDMFEAWKLWGEEQGRSKPGTKQTFGRDLRAAIPGLVVTQPREGGRRQRHYEGVALIAPPVRHD